MATQPLFAQRKITGSQTVATLQKIFFQKAKKEIIKHKKEILIAFSGALLLAGIAISGRAALQSWENRTKLRHKQKEERRKKIAHSIQLSKNTKDLPTEPAAKPLAPLSLTEKFAQFVASQPSRNVPIITPIFNGNNITHEDQDTIQGIDATISQINQMKKDGIDIAPLTIAAGFGSSAASLFEAPSADEIKLERLPDLDRLASAFLGVNTKNIQDVSAHLKKIAQENPYLQLPAIQQKVATDIEESILSEALKFGVEQVTIPCRDILGVSYEAERHEIDQAKDALKNDFEQGKISAAAWAIAQDAWQRITLDPYLALPHFQKIAETNPEIKSMFENKTNGNELEIAEKYPEVVMGLDKSKLDTAAKATNHFLKPLNDKYIKLRDERAALAQQGQAGLKRLAAIRKEIVEINKQIKAIPLSTKKIIDQRYLDLSSIVTAKYDHENEHRRATQILQTARDKLYQEYEIALPVKKLGKAK